MPSTIYAALIADVMESRARSDLRSLLGNKLAAISRRHLHRKLIQLPYSVTAGDEFQTFTRDLPSIPAVIQDLRVALRPLSLRIGVGFGSIAGPIQPPVNRLGGEAFQAARKAIESIKTGNLFKFEVLTDFVSQTDRLVEQKRRGKSAYLLHGLIHYLSAVIIAGFVLRGSLLSLRTYLVIAALTLVHLLIDLAKIQLARQYPACDGSWAYI